MDDVIQLSQIAPGRTDRVAAIGQTGSGKSWLMAYMLATREFVVVHDGKGTTWIPGTKRFKPEWQGYKLVRTVDELARVRLKGRDSVRLIYRPTAAAMMAGDERFFGWVYRSKGWTCYVDELTLVQTGTMPGRNLMSCITRGREKGIEMWIGTQRPMAIPKICLTEAEHTYSFFLKDLADRQRIESSAGIDSMDIWELQKREFLYARQADRETYGPYKLFVNEVDYNQVRDGVTPVVTPEIVPRVRAISWVDRLVFGRPTPL